MQMASFNRAGGIVNIDNLFLLFHYFVIYINVSCGRGQAYRKGHAKNILEKITFCNATWETSS